MLCSHVITRLVERKSEMEKKRFLNFRNDLAKLKEMVKTKLGMRVRATAIERPLSGDFS